MTDEKILSFLTVVERALWVVFGLFLGLMVADLLIGEQDWLFKWSTLIAGLLALAAGIMTVLAMIYIDQKQGERHIELMKLNLRGDALKVRRAAGQIDILENVTRRTKMVLKAAELAGNRLDGLADRAAFMKATYDASAAIGAFDRVGKFEEVKGFFDSDTSLCYARTLMAIELFPIRSEELTKALRTMPAADDPQAAFSALIDAARTLADESEGLEKGARRLVTQYEG